jgi:hypothetical protein
MDADCIAFQVERVFSAARERAFISHPFAKTKSAKGWGTLEYRAGQRQGGDFRCLMTA